uniref:Uncharacterized protein n=1 Tax=Phenylobacterium glaciei TaxID=2803784 RepID=A0A974P1S0_9CAUL|nr:hypothetical protein JKL49_15760 [Phenylobacterium glaciei]
MLSSGGQGMTQGVVTVQGLNLRDGPGGAATPPAWTSASASRCSSPRPAGRASPP